jgi:hypothetical protein
MDMRIAAQRMEFRTLETIVVVVLGVGTWVFFKRRAVIRTIVRRKINNEERWI